MDVNKNQVFHESKISIRGIDLILEGKVKEALVGNMRFTVDEINVCDINATVTLVDKKGRELINFGKYTIYEGSSLTLNEIPSAASLEVSGS